MNRVSQIVVAAVVLAALAAAQTPAPPAPTAPPAPAQKLAVPRVPAAPKAPTPPKPARSGSYLGVDIRSVTHENMAELKLKEPRGVEVMMVDRDAPAGEAGLQEHDVILSFNGKKIQSGEELRDWIRSTPPGQTVELGISRAGQPMSLKAQLADRSRIVVMAPKIRIRRIEVPILTTLSRRQGITVENLTPQLGEVFGVKNGEGVLVRSVEKGSPGESAGLRAGDVIVRVANQAVSDMSDWNRLVRRQKPGPVQIGIVREKRQQSLSLAIPENGEEQSEALGMGMEDFSRNMERFGREMQDYGRGMEEWKRLQPEIDRAMRDAQEKIRRDLERNKREWQHQSERTRQEAQRQLEKAQRELERSRRELEREQEKQDKPPAQPDKPPQL